MKKIFTTLQAADKFYLLPLLISTVSTAIISLTYGLFYSQLPDKLPLFYSLPWGKSQLASKEQIFILPAVLVLTTLINFLFSSQIHPAQLIFKRTLALSVIFIDLLLLITAIRIVLIFI